jgi:glucose/arabinose dehydrogenase
LSSIAFHVRTLAGFLALQLMAATAAAEIPLSTARVAQGLSLPVFVAAPPGDTSRLFIVEQGSSATASIKILDLTTNTILPRPFLTLTGISVGGERGLLGLAFHPDYASNGYFYVYVSDTDTSETIRRYRVSALPNEADPASVQSVLVMTDPWLNHNGGWIGFGPDGFLYVATGDSGYNPQDIHHLYGKILRIDVDGDDFPADANANYAIPPTNPYVGLGGAGEVWHSGLRNPWRASFDRATGDFYIGDVGQSSAEEIDFQPAGAGGLNYGWPCMEGDFCTGQDWACICNSAPLKHPISSYSHGLGCAVMAGYVYRGSALCGLQGTYFYADYCSARIWSFRNQGGVAAEFTDRTAELHPPGSLSIGLISSFGEDANGELYICDHADGEVYRIVAGTPVDCNQNGVQDACDISAGTSLDADGDGVPDECQPAATPICFGDGTGGSCPCGNRGSTGHGCENSAATGGAQLAYAGNARLSADTLVFMSAGELSSALSICLQGDAETSPTIFGDGLRCAGGHLKRLYVKSASGGNLTVPILGDPSVSTRSAALGSPIAPGSLRVYQTYYRDPSSAFCPTPPGSTFNASSGLRVRWGT